MSRHPYPGLACRGPQWKSQPPDALPHPPSIEKVAQRGEKTFGTRSGVVEGIAERQEVLGLAATDAHVEAGLAQVLHRQCGAGDVGRAATDAVGYGDAERQFSTAG